MRLLRTDSLVLEDFFDEQIPQYAILSHTWGAGEVTFQDIQLLAAVERDARDGTAAENKVRRKAGFAKVQKSAEIAAEDGYTYIWIDTCCIDKSSSAELSEAINSMFKWYLLSDVCYAILADVPFASEDELVQQDSVFRRSRWFTRGWTLQELIAPKTLRFFAQDWREIGSKGDDSKLVGALSEITGVPVPVLQGRLRPTALSVATRMRWAATRRTTRLEDIAYCLIGIFGVNIPLLYGEGLKAFARLQEAILKTTSDQSIFAWSSYPSSDSTGVDEDDDNLYGLFAQSPRQFKDARGIEPLPPSPSALSVPIEMTSHGLRVQLYLRPIWEEYVLNDNEDYYAILDCIVRIGTRDYCPTLWLRRVGADQYGRLRPHVRKLLAPVDYRLPSYIEGHRQIFVRENPTYYSLPEFNVPEVDMDPHSDALEQPLELQQSRTAKFELAEVFPDERWNPVTLTLRPVFSRSTEVLGLFRFRRMGTSKEFVDVAVGLKKVGGRKWEAWCLQRQVFKDELALPAVVTALNEDIKAKIREVQNKPPAHWFSLQSLVGHDEKLLSDARVQAVERQGRSYVCLFVLAKIEICPHRELDCMPEIAVPKSDSFARGVAELTRRFSVEDSLFKSGLETTTSVVGSRRLPLEFEDHSDVKTFLLGLLPSTTGSAAGKMTSAAQSDEPSDGRPQMKRLFKGKSSNRVLTRQNTLASINEEEQNDTVIRRGSVLALGKPHIAAIRGEPKTIAELFEEGYPGDIRILHGWTPLHFAAMLGHIDVIHAIFSAPDSSLDAEKLVDARTDDLLETPLHLAAAYAPAAAQVAIFRSIASHSPKTEDRTFSYLIARNALDETLLHRAAVSDNGDLIRYLVEETDLRNRAFNRSTELQSIVDTSNAEFTRQVDYVDKFGRTPLWHAAAVGASTSIIALVNLGARVDLTDDMGLTPLHAACREGCDMAVQILLNLGANPQMETPQLGLTPMHLSALFGHADCLQGLIRMGVNVNLGSQTKPVHLAVAGGHLECVKLLGDAGAWCGSPCDYTLTPSGDGDCAESGGGATTVEDIAERLGNEEILEYVKECRRKEQASGGGLPTSTAQDPTAPGATTEGTAAPGASASAVPGLPGGPLPGASDPGSRRYNLPAFGPPGSVATVTMQPALNYYGGSSSPASQFSYPTLYTAPFTLPPMPSGYPNPSTYNASAPGGVPYTPVYPPGPIQPPYPQAPYPFWQPHSQPYPQPYGQQYAQSYPQASYYPAYTPTTQQPYPAAFLPQPPNSYPDLQPNPYVPPAPVELDAVGTQVSVRNAERAAEEEQRQKERGRQDASENRGKAKSSWWSLFERRRERDGQGGPVARIAGGLEERLRLRRITSNESVRSVFLE